MLKYAVDSNIIIQLYYLYKKHKYEDSSLNKNVKNGLSDLLRHAIHGDVKLYVPPTVLLETTSGGEGKMTNFISELFYLLPQEKKTKMMQFYSAYTTGENGLFPEFQYKKIKNKKNKIIVPNCDALILAQCASAQLACPISDLITDKNLLETRNYERGIRLITLDGDFYMKNKKNKDYNLIKSFEEGNPISTESSIYDIIEDLNYNQFASVCSPIYPNIAVNEIENRLEMKKNTSKNANGESKVSQEYLKHIKQKYSEGNKTFRDYHMSLDGKSELTEEEKAEINKDLEMLFDKELEERMNSSKFKKKERYEKEKNRHEEKKNIKKKQYKKGVCDLDYEDWEAELEENYDNSFVSDNETKQEYDNYLKNQNSSLSSDNEVVDDISNSQKNNVDSGVSSQEFGNENNKISANYNDSESTNNSSDKKYSSDMNITNIIDNSISNNLSIDKEIDSPSR